jgi:hypothetical protein
MMSCSQRYLALSSCEDADTKTVKQKTKERRNFFIKRKCKNMLYKRIRKERILHKVFT